MLARVEAIREVLIASSSESERLRTLAPRAIAALAGSGLWLFKSPVEVGGAEADPLVQMDVIEAVTVLDPVAAWCLFIGASVVGSASARLPAEGLAELWSGADAPRMAGSLQPGGTATRVDGGFRISGRWGWSSGINHATWVNALCRVEGEQAPPIVAVVPRRDVEVQDTWYTMGMRGTGSADYSIADVFVPNHRLLGAQRRGGPLYGLGMPSFVLNEHASFALGVARRCLDAVVTLAGSKKRGYIKERTIADRDVFRRLVGRNEVRWQAARAAIRASYAAVWAHVRAGVAPTPDQVLQLRAMATFVNDEALDIVAQAHRYAAGTAAFSDNILAQGLADLQVASAHLMVSDTAFEAYGAARLGFATDPSIAGIN